MEKTFLPCYSVGQSTFIQEAWGSLSLVGTGKAGRKVRSAGKSSIGGGVWLHVPGLLTLAGEKPQITSFSETSTSNSELMLLLLNFWKWLLCSLSLSLSLIFSLV